MGSGFRTFTAGEVLTASNVQNYLMDQSVMVFGGSAARSSAIGTANFEEGMVSYLTDTDKVEAYNGTNWVSVAPTTTQGLTLINTTSFSAVASQSFNDVFSATYDYYRVLINLVASTSANINFRFRVGGTDNTAVGYLSSTVFARTNVTESFQSSNGQQNLYLIGVNTANKASIVMDIGRPFVAELTRITTAVGMQDATEVYHGSGGLLHNVSSSFDGFSIFPSTGTISGSVSIYGYSK
jgi:hypothetical protein